MINFVYGMITQILIERGNIRRYSFVVRFELWMCHPDGEIRMNHRIRLTSKKKAALNVNHGYLQDYRVISVKIAQRREIGLLLDVG